MAGRKSLDSRGKEKKHQLTLILITKMIDLDFNKLYSTRLGLLVVISP
jgi:hypothetical protein